MRFLRYLCLVVVGIAAALSFVASSQADDRRRRGGDEPVIAVVIEAPGATAIELASLRHAIAVHLRSPVVALSESRRLRVRGVLQITLDAHRASASIRYEEGTANAFARVALSNNADSALRTLMVGCRQAVDEALASSRRPRSVLSVPSEVVDPFSSRLPHVAASNMIDPFGDERPSDVNWDRRVMIEVIDPWRNVRAVSSQLLPWPDNQRPLELLPWGDEPIRAPATTFEAAARPNHATSSDRRAASRPTERRGQASPAVREQSEHGSRLSVPRLSRRSRGRDRGAATDSRH